MITGSVDFQKTPIHKSELSVSVVLDGTGLAADTLYPAGTIIGAATAILDDPSTRAAKVNDATAQAVLEHDVIVPKDGEVTAGACFKGVVYSARIEAAMGEAVDALAKGALEPLITFYAAV
jgi:hypothetical protein